MNASTCRFPLLAARIWRHDWQPLQKTEGTVEETGRRAQRVGLWLDD